MKKKILIIAIVIVVLIIAIVGGYFIYKKSNEDSLPKTTGVAWGDTYYEEIKNIQDALDRIATESPNVESNTENVEYGSAYYEGIPELSTDINIQFADFNKDDIPEMIATYKDKENHNALTIYTYDENNEDTHLYTSCKNISTKELIGKIEILYNIENQEYGYYLKSESITANDGSVRYLTIDEVLNETYTSDYRFKADELISNLEVADGETPTISKFDETFVEVGELDGEKLAITKDTEKDEMFDFVNQNVENIKNIDTAITDEAKNTVNTKLEEVQSAKQKIEEIQAKKEAEEAEKKEQELAAKKVYVGTYTNGYGDSLTITLNDNGDLIYNKYDEKYVVDLTKKKSDGSIILWEEETADGMYFANILYPIGVSLSHVTIHGKKWLRIVPK